MVNIPTFAPISNKISSLIQIPVYDLDDLLYNENCRRKNIYDTLLQEYFTVATEFEFYLNKIDFLNKKVEILTFSLKKKITKLKRRKNQHH